jgi:uncharacterized membrane protein YqaE (UPF0057 family)
VIVKITCLFASVCEQQHCAPKSVRRVLRIYTQTMATTTGQTAASQGWFDPNAVKQVRDAVYSVAPQFRGPPGDQPVPALGASAGGSTAVVAPSSHATAGNLGPIAQPGVSSGADTAGAATVASSGTPNRGQEPDAVEVVCDVCVPPIGVAIATDMDVPEVAVSCLLTLFGWLPGVIHALVVSAARELPKRTYSVPC